MDLSGLVRLPMSTVRGGSNIHYNGMGDTRTFNVALLFVSNNKGSSSFFSTSTIKKTLEKSSIYKYKTPHNKFQTKKDCIKFLFL